jgi:acyl carrier protein
MITRRSRAPVAKAAPIPDRVAPATHGNHRMSPQTAAERELAQLLVESLNLEDVEAGAIDPEAPLFNSGLGLDSIDALELALAISKHYGFQLRSDNDENRRIFASLRALSAHVETSKAG